MTQTTHLYKVTDALVQLITDNKVDLGLEDVWYGDQALIPRRPCVAVDPQTTERELAGAGAGGATENTFSLFLYVYHGTIQEVQKNRRDADVLVADLERLLHDNLTMGSRVIHGFVVRTESGQAVRGDVLAVTRMTWQGLSKTLLGVPDVD